MRTKQIDRKKVEQLLKTGIKQTVIARKLGVTQAAISQIKKELKVGTVKNVVIEQAPKVVAKSLNAIEQLQHINEVVVHILDELTGEEETTKRMVQAVQAVLDYEKEPTKDKLKDLKALILRINQDKNTAIKAAAEIRAQVGLQLEIFQTLHDIKMVAEFRETLIELLRRVDPKLRDEFIKLLDERQALQRALKAEPVKSLKEED